MTIGQREVPPAPAQARPAGAADQLPARPTVGRLAAGPRQWSLKGVALAVLVVVLGGLVLLYAVPQFSHRVSVLAVARDVPIGSTITADDLTTAKITNDPNLEPISASDRSSVVGQVAVVDLRAGTLLTHDELGASDGFTSGQVLVPLGLKEAQLPARGLAAGQHVLIISTPGNGDSGSLSDGSVPSSSTHAVVTEVGRTDQASGVTVVDVRVPASDAIALGQLASTGNLTVLLLPTGG